jgi:hypothetical protein
VPGNFPPLDDNTALSTASEEPGDEAVQCAAEGRLACPTVAHHHNRGALFRLRMDVIQGRSFLPSIMKREIFNRNCRFHKDYAKKISFLRKKLLRRLIKNAQMLGARSSEE